MKHHEFNDLENLASINQTYPDHPMARRQRIERWADLLEADPHRLLSTLYDTERLPGDTRAALRHNNSAISVAFDDPVLRAAGLKNDTYGEAKRFFELSDSQLHRLVCYCHFGANVTAEKTAGVIRAKHIRRGIFLRLRAMFVG